MGGTQTDQGSLAGELQGQGEFVGQGFFCLLLQDAQQAAFFTQVTALLFVVFKLVPGHITATGLKAGELKP